MQHTTERGQDRLSTQETNEERSTHLGEVVLGAPEVFANLCIHFGFASKQNCFEAAEEGQVEFLRRNFGKFVREESGGGFEPGIDHVENSEGKFGSASFGRLYPKEEFANEKPEEENWMRPALAGSRTAPAATATATPAPTASPPASRRPSGCTTRLLPPSPLAC